MKADDILDAVGDIDAKKVEDAHGAKKGRVVHPGRWLAVAAAFALVVLGAVTGLNGLKTQPGAETSDAEPTQQVQQTNAPAQPKDTVQSEPTAGNPRAIAASPHLLAAAVYPETPKREDVVDSEKAKAYLAYSRAIRDGVETYRGSLDEYLRGSLPALLSGEDGENKVCSPLNVYLALAMLAESTGGETRQQLLDLLGAEDVETLRTRAGALWNANYQDGQAGKCLLSSSLWLNEKLDYVAKTLKTLAEVYYADSFSGEMGSAGFDQTLRDWTNEQTGGQLEQYASELGFDWRTVLALVTAVDFHAKWLDEFRSENNAAGTFYSPNGERDCEYLCESGLTEPYWWGEHFSAVQREIDLGFGSGALWLILPDEGVSPEALMNDPELMDFLLCDKFDFDWTPDEAWEKSCYAKLNLKLPKFDVSARTDLIGALQSLGVTDVFEPGTADFSPILVENDALLPCVSRAEHAARLSVDEKGIDGAAYTFVEARGAGGPPEPTREVDFTLDRPFLFVLTGGDGLPLFAGIVNQP